MKRASANRDHAPHASARDRILNAAFTVLCERGYGATNTREIAARAQVSKRELYTEFGNKQGIFAALIASRASRMWQPVDGASVASAAAFEETLGRLGRAQLDQLTDPTTVAVFRLAIAAVEEAPEVARTLDRKAREPNRVAIVELMTKARAAGRIDGDPELMAQHFFSLVIGNILVTHLLGLAERPKERELQRRVEAAVSAFLQLYVPARERGTRRRPLAK
jgi:AcrR family transcriptional regulator